MEPDTEKEVLEFFADLLDLIKRGLIEVKRNPDGYIVALEITELGREMSSPVEYTTSPLQVQPWA